MTAQDDATAAGGSGGKANVIVHTTRLVIRALIRSERMLHALWFMPVSGRLANETPAGQAAGAPLDSSADARPLEILMAPRMRATLRYVLVDEKESGFLFDLLGRRSKSEELANIRLRVAIAPALERDAAPTEPVRLHLSLPAFVETSGDPARLRLHLTEGRRLDVTTGPGEILESLRLDGFAIASDAAFPAELSHALVMTIADWHRHMEPGSRGTIRRVEGDRLEKLFARIAGDLAALLKTLEAPIPYEVPGPAGLLGGVFGEDYRLVEANARFLVNLDANGQMIVDPEVEDRQQVDIEASMTSFTDPPGADLDFWIPDLLVSGNKYHARFVETLRSAEALKTLARQLDRKGIPVGRVRLEEFLAIPDVTRDAVVLRSVQKVGQRKERNIIVLDGQSRGQTVRLVFEARFDVSSWPEVEVNRLRSANLIAAFTDGQGWRRFGDADADPLSRYLSNVIMMLARWRARLHL